MVCPLHHPQILTSHLELLLILLFWKNYPHHDSQFSSSPFICSSRVAFNQGKGYWLIYTGNLLYLCIYSPLSSQNHNIVFSLWINDLKRHHGHVKPCLTGKVSQWNGGELSGHRSKILGLDV